METSKDPLVKECVALLFNPEFIARNQFPSECPSLLQMARESISQVTESSKPPCVKTVLKKSLCKQHTDFWNSNLDQLQVQSKFKDIVALEPESRTWNRLITGLPAGQLSFLLRAGTDCLPTPLNLRRWRYRISSSCPLCNSPSPTTVHILNGCQEALTQGRYTWRHDSVLNCIISLVLNEIPPCAKLYADLPGLRASESPPATLPADLSTSTARPDIVLVSEESVTMLELTIPSNSKEAITKAKERKTNKPNYSSLIGDLEERRLSVTYRTLEIGSLGHYLPDAALVFHTPSNSRNQKLNRFSRKPPKQLLPAHIIFLTQGILPAGTQTYLFIVHKTNCSHIF